MSSYKVTDKNGRSVMYGFDKAYSGYFVTVWEGDPDEEDPIIERDRFSGMTGSKLVEMLENELGITVPEPHREQALMDLPIEDE